MTLWKPSRVDRSGRRDDLTQVARIGRREESRATKSSFARSVQAERIRFVDSIDA